MDDLGTDPVDGTHDGEGVTPTGDSDPEVVPKSEFEKIKAERDEQHGRATRAEAKVKELTTPKQNLSIDDKVDLRLSGYSKEDIELIERNFSESIPKTLENPYVKAAIEGVKKTRQAEESTPEPSSNIPTFTKDKKTWAQMTPDERRANYHGLVDNISKRGNTRVE